MEIAIKIEKRHLYAFIAASILILGAFMVSAFGGSNPTVMGHSAGELIVDNSSIVDDSITAADINSLSLASECAQITGSAGLCDGADNGITSESDPQVSTLGGTNNVCYQNAGNAIDCDYSSFNWNGGAQTLTVGSGAGVITMNSGSLVLTASGSPVTISSTGNINIISSSGTGTLTLTAATVSSTGTMGPGSATVFRCGGGSYVGVLTTDGTTTCLGLGGHAGANTDTGLRVD